MQFQLSNVNDAKQGVFSIAQPPPDVLINKLLDLLLKQDDPERSFVKFKDGDELVLLVNNMGGMSVLEMGSVVDEVLIQLGTCHLSNISHILSLWLRLEC